MASVHEPESRDLATEEVTSYSFGPDFLQDELLPPAAWKMLFDLYAGHANGQSIEVCELLTSKRSPARFAGRCLDALIERKFIALSPGPGRRFRRVSITPEGFAALRAKMLAR